MKVITTVDKEAYGGFSAVSFILNKKYENEYGLNVDEEKAKNLMEAVERFIKLEGEEYPVLKDLFEDSKRTQTENGYEYTCVFKQNIDRKSRILALQAFSTIGSFASDIVEGFTLVEPLEEEKMYRETYFRMFDENCLGGFRSYVKNIEPQYLSEKEIDLYETQMREKRLRRLRIEEVAFGKETDISPKPVDDDFFKMKFVFNKEALGDKYSRAIEISKSIEEVVFCNKKTPMVCFLETETEINLVLDFPKSVPAIESLKYVEDIKKIVNNYIQGREILGDKKSAVEMIKTCTNTLEFSDYDILITPNYVEQKMMKMYEREDINEDKEAVKEYLLKKEEERYGDKEVGISDEDYSKSLNQQFSEKLNSLNQAAQVMETAKNENVIAEKLLDGEKKDKIRSLIKTRPKK